MGTSKKLEEFAVYTVPGIFDDAVTHILEKRISRGLKKIVLGKEKANILSSKFGKKVETAISAICNKEDSKYISARIHKARTNFRTYLYEDEDQAYLDIAISSIANASSRLQLIIEQAQKDTPEAIESAIKTLLVVAGYDLLIMFKRTVFYFKNPNDEIIARIRVYVDLADLLDKKSAGTLQKKLRKSTQYWKVVSSLANQNLLKLQFDQIQKNFNSFWFHFNRSMKYNNFSMKNTLIDKFNLCQKELRVFYQDNGNIDILQTKFIFLLKQINSIQEDLNNIRRRMEDKFGCTELEEGIYLKADVQSLYNYTLADLLQNNPGIYTTFKLAIPFLEQYLFATLVRAARTASRIVKNLLITTYPNNEEHLVSITPFWQASPQYAKLELLTNSEESVKYLQNVMTKKFRFWQLDIVHKWPAAALLANQFKALATSTEFLTKVYDKSTPEDILDITFNTFKNVFLDKLVDTTALFIEGDSVSLSISQLSKFLAMSCVFTVSSLIEVVAAFTEDQDESPSDELPEILNEKLTTALPKASHEQPKPRPTDTPWCQLL